MTENKKPISPVLILTLIMGTAIGSAIIWQQVVAPSLDRFERQRAAFAEPRLDGPIIESQHCIVSDDSRTCEPVTCYVQTNGDLYCKRGGRN